MGKMGVALGYLVNLAGYVNEVSYYGETVLVLQHFAFIQL